MNECQKEFLQMLLLKLDFKIEIQIQLLGDGRNAENHRLDFRRFFKSLMAIFYMTFKRPVPRTFFLSSITL
jgi:hypothetical protein